MLIIGRDFLKGNIKRIMLSEFEKRIDEIMLLSSNEENFNKIINLINYQKIVGNYADLICRIKVMILIELIY